METNASTQQPSRNEELLSMENGTSQLDTGKLSQEPSSQETESPEVENVTERTRESLIDHETNRGTEESRVDLKKVSEDVWYETDQVWYVNKEGFTLVLGQGAKGWQMEFNLDKCEVLHFGKANQGRTYTLS
eukprot:g39020.t1